MFSPRRRRVSVVWLHPGAAAVIPGVGSRAPQTNYSFTPPLQSLVIFSWSLRPSSLQLLSPVGTRRCVAAAHFVFDGRPAVCGVSVMLRGRRMFPAATTESLTRGFLCSCHVPESSFLICNVSDNIQQRMMIVSVSVNGCNYFEKCSSQFLKFVLQRFSL